MPDQQPNLFTRPTSPFVIGTSGWTYADWKGTFYPPGLAKSRWFDYYAGLFSSVEINATFYRAFPPRTFQSWRERAPDSFLYALKVPRSITHEKLLLDTTEDILQFKQSANLLGDKLGIILLQMSPDIPFDPARLKRCLADFNLPGKVAVEFRNDAWEIDSVRELLSRYQSIYVNVDSPRAPLTGYLTSDNAYIRLHGRKAWYRYDYSDEELSELAQVARKAIERGAKQVFIYFNNDYDAIGPKNALSLMKLLERSN